MKKSELRQLIREELKTIKIVDDKAFDEYVKKHKVDETDSNQATNDSLKKMVSECVKLVREISNYLKINEAKL